MRSCTGGRPDDRREHPVTSTRGRAIRRRPPDHEEHGDPPGDVPRLCTQRPVADLGDLEHRRGEEEDGAEHARRPQADVLGDEPEAGEQGGDRLIVEDQGADEEDEGHQPAELGRPPGPPPPRLRRQAAVLLGDAVVLVEVLQQLAAHADGVERGADRVEDLGHHGHRVLAAEQARDQGRGRAEDEADRADDEEDRHPPGEAVGRPETDPRTAFGRLARGSRTARSVAFAPQSGLVPVDRPVRALVLPDAVPDEHVPARRPGRRACRSPTVAGRAV